MDIFNNKDNLLVQLKKILSHGEIRTVYQPIISLKDGGILGYEALSRGPAGSPLESPLKLFGTAMENNMVWELEQLCRIKALERSKNTLNGHMLFLNVDPHIINDDKFRKGFTRDFLNKYNINPNNIIFEITEKSAICDFKNFRRVLDNYVDQGYKIAIDDTGSGYSGLRMLAETCPQYIKIDMDLVRDIDKDYLKQALLKTFHQFALMTNMSIIAEGIETEDELKALVDIGIDYGQGYLIQKPAEGFLKISPTAKEIIRAKNQEKNRLFFVSPTTLPIGEIARFEAPISANTTGQEVDYIFRNNPTIHGIPIVDSNNKPIGLITRNKFYTYLSSQYGYALYKIRPIDIIKDSNPLILDYYTPLDQVSWISVTRNGEQLYDNIIITRKHSYFGIITMKDLLVKTTKLELNIAKHSNPLTGLPGNLLIEEKLKETITLDTFAVIYIDLDNFKSYNDVYGFENGDQLIRTTASLLSQQLTAICPGSCFLGHIGGDDFLIITNKDKVELLCRAIIEKFDREKLNFYSEQDKKNGFILAKSREGIFKKIPLLTISLAVVIGTNKTYNNICQLTEKTSEIKERCKQETKSCYCIYANKDF